MTTRHQPKCDEEDAVEKAYKNHIHFIEVLEDVLVVLLVGKNRDSPNPSATTIDAPQANSTASASTATKTFP